MKFFVIFALLISPLTYAKKIRIVQVDKTFLYNVTDQQAESAFDDPTIEEKYKVEELEASVGDTIEFANRDEVNHNVSAMAEKNTLFDVKLQSPGATHDRSMELKKAGTYDIQCAIHPKMKIKLKVK